MIFGEGICVERQHKIGFPTFKLPTSTKNSL